jgi:hypothetical protein
MECYEQPLSRHQKKVLEEIVGLPAYLFRVTLFLACILILGAFLRALQHLLWSSPPLWAGVTALLAFWLYRTSVRWTGGPGLRRRVRRDLEAGKALVKVIVPVQVEKVAEEEDEGPAYIIETEEGESCLFCSQSLIEYEDQGFPWARIGVVTTPFSRQLLELRPLGEPIAVTRLLSPFTYSEARGLGCLHAEFVILDEEKCELLRGFRLRMHMQGVEA